jgi:hypothetical protein
MPAAVRRGVDFQVMMLVTYIVNIDVFLLRTIYVLVSHHLALSHKFFTRLSIFWLVTSTPPPGDPVINCLDSACNYSLMNKHQGLIVSLYHTVYDVSNIPLVLQQQQSAPEDVIRVP